MLIADKGGMEVEYYNEDSITVISPLMKADYNDYGFSTFVNYKSVWVIPINSILKFFSFFPPYFEHLHQRF